MRCTRIIEQSVHNNRREVATSGRLEAEAGGMDAGGRKQEAGSRKVDEVALPVADNYRDTTTAACICPFVHSLSCGLPSGKKSDIRLSQLYCCTSDR